MRSTFNILFYVNKSKEKNGVVPVMGRVTINGTQSQFSCKKSIPLDLWDVKGNCAKGRSKEALQINRELDNIKAQIIKHYQHLSNREAFVTAEMVRNSYQGFGSEYETLLSAFDKDNIVDINGDKWIIGHRHKTGIPFQVKLMDVPLQIINRYKHLQEDKLVFGKMNYWSMCKKLKKVMEACGIEKSISFHCGRHSFATLALSKGMPIESVSRVLGHTNIVTTQIYAKITSQKLNNDLTMLGDKLNASFKDIKTA